MQHKNKTAQTLLEFTLILALVTIIAIAILTFLNAKFQNKSNGKNFENVTQTQNFYLGWLKDI